MRGQDTRDGEEEWEPAALLHDYSKKKHHLHQGMESKHAGDAYACRAEIRPPLLPAAEIKDLLLDGPPMIYI